MVSQYSNQPPPPHLPQPHFHGAPDIDIGLTDQGNRAVPESGYSFCALDALPRAFPKSKFSGKVLLLGYDGSLEVLALENTKSRAVGGLDGLNGRVVDAKILTWASGNDPFAALRPLVAVTVHGPYIRTDSNNGGDSSSASDQVDAVPGVAATKQDRKEEPPQMQTRVEVYSLRNQTFVSTLFATKPTPILDSFLPMASAAPAPAGGLKLHASGNFLVLASGASGEVFIYGVVSLSSSGGFQCLSKVWTAIQPKEVRRSSNSSNSTDQDDASSEAGRASAQPDTPILSVSGRWLAVVCPPPTRVSIHGIIPPALTQKRPYGIDAYSPPSRPSVTCAVDSGAGESLLNKFARGVTQELVRGARWIGDQGMQSWNSYWNKDSIHQAPQPPAFRRPQPPEPYPNPNLLPPTHAHDNQPSTANEPDLVSVFDLKQLENSPDLRSSSPTPMATFQPPNGCSYLSFSPTGLMLLTASRNGDVQYIWDLMQIRHCRARAFLAEDASSMNSAANPPAAHVRLVAHYPRLTASSIMDVVWTAPIGDQLAITTRKGTVHVYTIPPSAFQWPPLRRVSTSTPAPTGEGSPPRDERPDDATAGSRFSSALNFVGGKTQPIFAAVRGRAPSVGAAFTGAAGGFALSSNAGVRSGKAVASGLSKSVGAATNTLRHVGENRLHLANTAKDGLVSRVAWCGDEASRLLVVIDGGCVRVYHVGSSSSSGNNNKQNQPVVGPKTAEIQLPAHAQYQCGRQQPLTHPTEANVSGFWSVPSAVPGGGSASSAAAAAAAARLKTLPLSQAEIESNAPYQPFHTDRRVNMKVYPAEYADKMGSGQPWAFGDDIPTTTKIRHRAATHHSHEGDDDNDNGDAAQPTAPGEMENLVALGGGGNGEAEHIVITTRRKKKGAAAEKGAAGQGGALGDDDGFFEDDCDVLDFALDRV